MLRNTFLHVQGVGPATEARLWSEGVLSWDDLDKLPDTSVGRGVAERIRRTIGESEQRLAARDAAWFSERLRSGSYAWRMFEDFREDTAFIDIETTGLNIGQDVITSIAVWDRQGARAFVRGRNLHEFADALSEHAVWVHFNGLRFDVPFIATSSAWTFRRLASWTSVLCWRRWGSEVDSTASSVSLDLIGRASKTSMARWPSTSGTSTSVRARARHWRHWWPTTSRMCCP